MMYTVYILYSSSTEKYYTGQTQNFINRLNEHNSGETKSIRNGIPWNLCWKTDLPTRNEAMALERKIKNYGAKRFLSITR